MPTFPLAPHHATPPSSPAFDFWVSVERSAAFGADATLNLFYCVGAPASRFVLPDDREPARTDELWRSTCFEAFLRAEDGDGSYAEWNFAPSGAWAAYEFTAPRRDMANAVVRSPPYIRLEDNLTWFTLGATIAIPSERSFALGLSAVLEERDGTKSYWALAHGPGAPDFHDPDCFTARLP